MEDLQLLIGELEIVGTLGKALDVLDMMLDLVDEDTTHLLTGSNAKIPGLLSNILPDDNGTQHLHQLLRVGIKVQVLGGTVVAVNIMIGDILEADGHVTQVGIGSEKLRGIDEVLQGKLTLLHGL